ncbi:protein MAIN-LIKE 2-like [Amaranthus tricolor]|uniref:protein MAIN-LIKE 2-like n=1 Tax=Amaranthus tricolor TaxID=29722 RepID=UPI00258C06C7|nr:protein MAIN-LIKE 2-like [Amaranthus tricolor]
MDLAAPGPLDPSVLTMQANHRSSVLWDVQVSDTETMYTRHLDSAPWAIDAWIVPYLQHARLHDFHLIAYGRVDRALVTALVERWRQETHTFHLPIGEATVTLLDVAALTRLPIEGHAVCIDGRQFESWEDKVQRLLGVRPPAEVTKGSSLRVTWLAQNFSHLPEGADDANVERYARAYLLYLIGAVLFSDKTGNRVLRLFGDESFRQECSMNLIKNKQPIIFKKGCCYRTFNTIATMFNKFISNYILHSLS